MKKIPASSGSRTERWRKKLLVEAVKPRVGKWVVAFDAAACIRTGSGNRCHQIFWKPAKIVNVCVDTVDIVWLGKNEIVRGVPIEDINQLTPYWSLFLKNFGPK